MDPTNTTDFNWLHLTDLHFGQKDQAHLLDQVKGPFFEDLEKLHKQCGPFQAVFFTGDLVDRGTEQQFADFESEFLGPLWDKLETLGSGDAILFAVPGNHDLVRPKLNEATRALTQQFPEVSSEFWTQGDREHRTVVNDALSNYNNWWRDTKYRDAHPIDEGLLPGDFSTTIQVGKRRVGVVGLNTTFLQLQGGDFQGRLHLDFRQLYEVCHHDTSAWAATHDACILLTHQGREWLTKESCADYVEINREGRFVLHLFGHMHKPNFVCEGSLGGAGRNQLQGSSQFGNSDKNARIHGYSAGRVRFFDDRAEWHIWPRIALKPEGQERRFVRDSSVAKLESDGGTKPQPVAMKQKPPTRNSNKAKSDPAKNALPKKNPLEVYCDIVSLISDNCETLDVLNGEVFKKILNQKNSGICEIALQNDGVGRILKAIRDWFNNRANRKLIDSLSSKDLDTIKELVECVVVFSIDATWVDAQRVSLAYERIEHSLSNTDARIPEFEINTYGLLVAAIKNKPFDLDRLGRSEKSEPEHSYDPTVLGEGFTNEDLLNQIKKDIVGFIYKDEPDIDRNLKDPVWVERKFSDACQVINTEPNPIRLLIKGERDPDSKYSNAMKKELGLTALFIFCDMEDADQAANNLVGNFNLLKQIRDSLSKFQRRASKI